MTALLRDLGYEVGFQYEDGTEEPCDDAVDWHAANRHVWVLDDELGRVCLSGAVVGAVVYVGRTRL